MRFVFSIICVFFLSLSLSAQHFNGGIIGGFVATQISGDGLGGFNKYGFQLGGFVNKKYSDTLQLELQMYYLQKGSRKTANLISGNLYTYRLQLDYIEIPVLLRYNFKKKINFEVGISEAVLFNSKVSNAFGELPKNDPENRPFRKFETAFLFGASYPLNQKWLVYIRNSNSILPVRKHLSGSFFRLNWGQYNSVMQFGLQHSF